MAAEHANSVLRRCLATKVSARWSVASLLWLTTIVGIFCGTIGHRLVATTAWRNAVAQLQSAGASIAFDNDDAGIESARGATGKSRLASWAATIFGQDRSSESVSITFSRPDAELSPDGYQALERVGVVKSLRFTNWSANQALFEVLAKPSQVERLSISGPNVIGHGVGTERVFPSVRYLDLSGTASDDATCQLIVSSFPNVETVDLHETLITDLGIATLSKLQELTGLDISKTNVDDAAIPILRGLPRIQSLNVAECNITYAGLSSMSGSTSVVSLKFGGFASAERSRLCLVDMPLLEELRWDGEPSSPAVVELANLRALHELSVPATSVRIAAMFRLRRLVNSGQSLSIESCGELEEANLEGSQLSAEELGVFGGCPRLRALNLTGWHPAGGLVDLSPLKNLRQLTVLDLSSTDVSDDECPAFEAMTHLRFLGLRRCDVTDRGLIDSISKVSGLTTLDLSYCTAITDRGIASLASLRSLRLLRLNGILATPQVIEHLRAAIGPNVQIEI